MTNVISSVSLLVAMLASVVSWQSAKASRKAAGAAEVAANAASELTRIERSRREEEVNDRVHAAAALKKAKLELKLVPEGSHTLIVVTNHGPAVAREVFVHPVAVNQDGAVPQIDDWVGPQSIDVDSTRAVRMHVDLSSTTVYGVECQVRWEDDEPHSQRMSADLRP